MYARSYCCTSLTTCNEYVMIKKEAQSVYITEISKMCVQRRTTKFLVDFKNVFKNVQQKSEKTLK